MFNFNRFWYKFVKLLSEETNYLITQPEQASWNEVEIPISGNQKDPEPLIMRIKPISLIC